MYYRPGYRNVTDMEHTTVFDTDMAVAFPAEVGAIASDVDGLGMPVLAQNLGSLAREAEEDSEMIGCERVLVLLRAHDARTIAHMALAAGVGVETVAEFPPFVRRMLESTGISPKDETAILYDYHPTRGFRRGFTFPRDVMAKILQHSA